MTDYAIIQILSELRFILSSVVVPLGLFTILGFTVTRILANRRRSLPREREILDRLDRIERKLDALPSSGTKALEERIENLETIVVDEEVRR